MKRKLIIMLLPVYMLSAAYSQEKYYYFYTDEQIKENRELNRHKRCQILHLDSDSTFTIGKAYGLHSELVIINAISIGTFKLIKDVLYCYDKRLNRTYRFRQIDFYTLEALNHTAVFVQGTKLYLHYYSSGTGQSYSAFYHPDDLIKSDYWNTGVKNGIHRYDDVYNKSGLYYYQNNILVDSITLIYSLHKDSASIAKEIFFVEKYGNENNITTYYHNDFELKLCEYTYLLSKGDNIISVGECNGYLRHLRYAIYQESIDLKFKDISAKYEFTLSSKNNSLMIVSSFKSSSPDEIPIFNVGDTLEIRR